MSIEPCLSYQLKRDQIICEMYLCTDRKDYYVNLLIIQTTTYNQLLIYYMGFLQDEVIVMRSSKPVSFTIHCTVYMITA